MKIGLADVYAELTKQAWKQWEKEFHSMATAKEWDDTSPPSRAGVFFPGMPTYLARIMYRLHVGVWRCMRVPTKCECGMSVSFHLVMFSCTSCSDHFQPLTRNYLVWDCPCVQKAWQCATSVKDGASYGLQPDWSTPVHWQPTCSMRDHRLRSTLSRSSG